MIVKLLMTTSNGARRAFDVPAGTTIIGRSRSCDIRIALPTIDRRHCQISREGDQLVLEDLESGLGTIHNGRQVRRVDLAAGDRVSVGPVSFVVAIDDDQDSPRGSLTEVKSLVVEQPHRHRKTGYPARDGV